MSAEVAVADVLLARINDARDDADELVGNAISEEMQEFGVASYRS